MVSVKITHADFIKDGASTGRQFGNPAGPVGGEKEDAIYQAQRNMFREASASRLKMSRNMDTPRDVLGAYGFGLGLALGRCTPENAWKRLLRQ